MFVNIKQAATIIKEKNPSPFEGWNPIMRNVIF